MYEHILYNIYTCIGAICTYSYADCVSLCVYNISDDFVRFAMQAPQSAQGQLDGASREKDSEGEGEGRTDGRAVGAVRQVRQRSVTFLRSRGHMPSYISDRAALRRAITSGCASRGQCRDEPATMATESVREI